MTVGELRRRIAADLARAGIDGGLGNPELDARLLAAHALGCAPGDVVLMDERRLERREAAAMQALAERRASGEPLARIVGEKEFWSLPLTLAPETLVPRPDTETVVEAALTAARRGPGPEAPLSVLDLGTGSGAILLALLSELPRAFGVGVDLSLGACRAARRNAARLGLADRAAFVVADWDGPLGTGFDVIVANPPYVVRGEIDALAVEVRRHEPHIALDGGVDGLVAHRAVVGAIGRLMKAGGAAFVEIGIGQEDRVAGLAVVEGLVAGGHRDLAGIVRVLELRRT